MAHPRTRSISTRVTAEEYATCDPPRRDAIGQLVAP